jgi:hypothetical protein
MVSPSAAAAATLYVATRRCVFHQVPFKDEERWSTTVPQDRFFGALQTTDKKVNEVSPALFAEAPDAVAMAVADVARVHDLIRQIGLAPTKSKNVVGTAKRLVELHGGEVPCSLDELEALPGVGHKTASVIMAQCFGCALCS